MLQVVYDEFEGFSCHGYETEKPRRALRQCNIYVICPPLQLDDIKPIVCGKIKLPQHNNRMATRCDFTKITTDDGIIPTVACPHCENNLSSN